MTSSILAMTTPIINGPGDVPPPNPVDRNCTAVRLIKRKTAQSTVPKRQRTYGVLEHVCQLSKQFAVRIGRTQEPRFKRVLSAQDTFCEKYVGDLLLIV